MFLMALRKIVGQYMSKLWNTELPYQHYEGRIESFALFKKEHKLPKIVLEVQTEMTQLTTGPITESCFQHT